MKWIPITEGVWGGDIVECLVKLKSGKIVRLNYNYNDEFWYYPSTDETPTAIKKDCGDIVAWVDCKEVDKDLNCNADRDLAWNFGTEWMDRAIPALNLWIDKGISHPADLEFDTWKSMLIKIRDAFVATDYIYSDEYDKLSLEDKEKKCNIALALRKEAFKILAERYLDLWD